MLTVFSPTVERMLRAAGWHEHRRVDAAPYIAELERDGYPVYPVVKDALERFGGIRVFYANSHGAPIDLNFDLLDAYASPANVADDSERMGVPFCFVGEHDSPWDTLMMASDGRVFIRYPNGLSLAGANIEEATEALLTNDDSLFENPL